MPADEKRVVSCGAVVHRLEDDPVYLLLQYTARHWDLPKGHQEPGETEEETTRREVQEETGITDLIFLPGFRETIQYSYSGRHGRVQKSVIFRIAETHTPRDAVRLSHEHVAFEWLRFPEATARLTHTNARSILAAAHQEILTRRDA